MKYIMSILIGLGLLFTASQDLKQMHAKMHRLLAEKVAQPSSFAKRARALTGKSFECALNGKNCR